MPKPRKILIISFALLLFLGTLTLFLTSSYRFVNFCDHLFKEEVSSNALTLHYTLKDEAAYKISPDSLSLGSFDTDSSKETWWLRLKLLQLKTISKSLLSSDFQKKYDNLSYFLRTELNGQKFSSLKEPLVPSIGIQSQLPILLAEYTFADEEDVKTYLNLLSCIPEYFDSLIAFENDKLSSNLFMDPETATELISYCDEFLKNKESHFLIETFKSRLTALELEDTKASNYIEENKTALNTYLYPSYEKLRNFLKEHEQDGHTTDGLFYLPEGTDYYAWLIRSEVGSNRSFEEIEQLLNQTLKKDAAAIAKLTKEDPTLLSSRKDLYIDTSNPAALTTYLSKRSEHDFPKIPSVTLTIHHVPSSMEDHLSPAFYLIPPIDDMGNNVIYLNNKSLEQGLSLFTTLAHESYPGHLYQTVYENSLTPHPVQRLLNFGGYTEGWGTYAEQMSYFYAPIPEELATVLSSLKSMTLNLYAHLDLYIHAYGWTEDDCTAYLKKFGVTNAESIHQMFLLAKQQPANYLKYYLGYLEICHLKELARNCLGSEFDLKEFHTFLLDNGPAPFPLLKTYLQEWLIEQQQGFSEMENP